MILEKIVEVKKEELRIAKEKVPLAELSQRSAGLVGRLRGFRKAILQPGRINLIAEIKKASPSQGVFTEKFNPVEIAKAYESSGACALSILTEKRFFQGELAYLQAVRKVVNLPLLRKDFIIDTYQIYETVCAGADSILLIAQLLSGEQLKQFISICKEVKLDAVCEVHNEEDMEKVLDCGCAIVGINNRCLQTFTEDLQLSARLIKKIPKDKVVISESGVKTFADISYLQQLGINAVLIGETFMRSRDIPAKVKEVMGYSDQD